MKDNYFYTMYDNRITMLIIVNRIQFLYYSSYYKVFKVNNLFFFINNRPYCDGQQVPPASVRCIFL